MVIGEPPIVRPVGTVAATDVTLPAPLPLNVVQSAAERHPACEPDAVWQPIVRSAERSPPPVIGEVTLIARVVETLLLKMDQSVVERAPRFEADAVGMLKVTAVVDVAMVKSVPAVPVRKEKDVVEKPLMLVVENSWLMSLRVFPLHESPVPAVILFEGVL